jgi:hypothetical protein
MPKEIKIEDLCDTTFIAKELGVSTACVSNWHRRGHIESVEWMGSSSLYHWPTILWWAIETGHFKGTVELDV